MPQTQNMPTLGILFDIDKIDEYVDPGNYLIGAWKVVFRAVGTSSLKEWRGALLYECDTDGEVGGCCVAIQDMYEPLLHRIRETISQSSEFQQVAAPPIFLENEEARAQPLMMAGTVDGSGNIIGDETYCSVHALDAVKNENSP